MQCREFSEYAERWMEGEPPAEAAAHLETCSRCRGLIGDLKAIQAAARELGAEVEPPARVWVALRAQLESEGLIGSRVGANPIVGFFRALYRPALGAAYLSVLLAAAVFLSRESSHHYQQMAQRDVAPPEIASLQVQLAGGGRAIASLHDHDPQVAASYRENLRIVDNVILECEKRMQQEPQDEIAREYLYGAYQQKAELLNTMWERGATGE